MNLSKIVSELRQKFLTDSFSQSVAKLAGGAAIAQALTLAVSPVLSRLYDPGDFGVLGVFASFTAIATMFAALRYEQAIPLADSDEEATNVALLSVFVLISLCVIGLAVLSYTVIAGYPMLDGLPPAYLLLLPFSVFAGSIYRIFVNLTIRSKNYGPIATTKLYQSVGQVVVQLGLGLWRPHPLGLIAGFMVSQGGGSLTLFTKNKAKGSLLKKVSGSSIRHVARKFKEFPLVLSWAILLNSAAMHLPGVLIAKYYGVGAAGLFYLSRRVLGAPMVLLRTSVSQVFLGEASSLYRENPVKLNALFHSTSRKLLKMGSLVCIPAAVVSPYLFPLVFGANWTMAGQITQILALFQLCQFTIGPLMQVLIIIGRRKTQLMLDVVRFSLVILSFYITSLTDRGVLFALMIYVLTASLFYGLNYLYISILLKRASENGHSS